jgi:hypothetical protein
MMGVMVPETCSAVHMFDKLLSSIWLVFFSTHDDDARTNTHQFFLRSRASLNEMSVESDVSVVKGLTLNYSADAPSLPSNYY